MLIVEAERNIATHYLDACFKSHKAPTPEQEVVCYSSAKGHLIYQFIATLNFQPAFWKNTSGRCVDTKGTDLYKYFECRWWNEIEPSLKLLQPRD